MQHSTYSPPPAYDAYSNKKGFAPSSPAGASPGRSQNVPHNNLFPPGQWRDIWAAILFYVHLTAVMGFAGYSIWLLSKHPARFDFNDRVGSGDNNIYIPIATVLISVGVSGLCALGFLKATHVAPEGMIKASFFANILLSIALFVIILLSGVGLSAFIALILAVLSVVMYFMYRKHIPLSAAILKTVIDVLSEYPALINVTIVSVVAQVAHLLLLLVCAAGLYDLNERKMVASEALTAISVYLSFSLFWTSQVIQNVALTTIAGVYATFYFSTGAQGSRVTNPTAKSFGRAISWSFGSICFGSLIVALLQLVRNLVRNNRERNDLAGAIFDCLIKIVEDLVRYFNYYAYIHVAIYGKPYIQSAKDVWQLLKRNGIFSIINDSIIGTFCMMASIAIACGCAILTFLTLKLLSQDTNTAVVSGYVSLFAGSLISYLVLEIIQSGATTTMVCLSEDPGALQRTKPALYEQLATKYPAIFYNWRYP